MEFASPSAGFVTAVDTEKVGMAGVLLGGGRARKEDDIDPAVGFEVHARLGDEVDKGDPLVTIHYNDDARLARAQALLSSAWTLGDERPETAPLIRELITVQT